MPTNRSIRRKRFLAAGHFSEERGYSVDRPGGCHDWLLIYTIRGSGRFFHASGDFSTKPHEAVLISPGAAHRYEVASDAPHWELLWSHFLPPSGWRTWLKWPAPAPGWGRVALAGRQRRKEVCSLFRAAIDQAAGYRYHREALALNSLQAVLLGCHEQVVESHPQGLDPRIGDVLDFVCRNLDNPLSVEQLARRCHLSPSRFAHLFREHVQMTPQQYVERQRIDRARELLEHTGYSIAGIARQIGFENPFYFTRRFKIATGLSPREFRRQSQDS